VFETHIDLLATQEAARGRGVRSLWRHIGGSRAAWRREKGVIFPLKLYDVIHGDSSADDKYVIRVMGALLWMSKRRVFQTVASIPIHGGRSLRPVKNMGESF